MDRTHNPEFTMMEIYVAYKDYTWMMEFCEKLIEFCAIMYNKYGQNFVKMHHCAGMKK